MAARVAWKGSLKLRLIAIPIRVFPATSAGADVSFRQLHRRCHTPIQLKKWCPHCEEEVSADDVVKGYESSKGEYVVVEEDEIARLRPEATRTVDISHVLGTATIDPVYVERTYYLAPDNKAAGSAFAVVREALAQKAGIGRLALHGREYLVAVVARGSALHMYTLRTAGEIHEAASIDALEFGETKTRPDEVKLARQVLNSFSAAEDLSVFTDHYQEALKRMLSSKTAEPAVDAESAKAPKVVNLMEALRQSLASVRSRQAGPGRRKASVVAHPSSKARRRKAS